MILSAVAIAILFPARGGFASAWDTVTTGAIAFLFFLYGARLSPAEAFEGLKHWRLHTLILAFTYVVFPIIGIALFPLQHLVGHNL